jgi:hypothetical protein
VQDEGNNSKFEVVASKGLEVGCNNSKSHCKGLGQLRTERHLKSSINKDVAHVEFIENLSGTEGLY